MKKTIGQILSEIRPEFDFSGSQNMIEDGVLDSHDMIVLVAELETAYGIRIPGKDIVPENFRDISTIQALIENCAAKS